MLDLKTFQALIFDFDGVILDSEPLHYRACSDVLKSFGLMPSYDEYVAKYLGFSDKEMFPALFADKECSISLDEMHTLIAQKAQRYQEIIQQSDNLPMIDSVAHFLFYASSIISKVGICSGSARSEIMAVLKKLNQGKLQTYFRTIVTSEDVQRGKPSPEGYLLTAERLGVSSDQCLVIEDTPHGIEAAKTAGMYVVALLTSYKREQLKNADWIISKFSQLMTD